MKNEVEIVIRPNMRNGQYFRELWHYRELFYFLAWRDILIRYKQTTIGIAWIVIRSVATILVFTTVFGRIAGLPSKNVPYPILVCAAMLPWQFFASAVTESSTSLIQNANMLSKVYFPRLIIPTSSIIVCLADFLISLVILAFLMVWYGVQPHWRMITLPLFLSFSIMSALGFGLWLSALTVKYRDVKYIVPFLVQFGLFISPVGFSSTIIPDRWRMIYSLNPMADVIDGFRWAMFGDEPFYWPGFIILISVTVVILLIGINYFRRTEQAFTDIL